MTSIMIKDQARLLEAAKQFIEAKGNAKIIAFKGAMGAGKTTFIRALCQIMNVVDTVNSPTFAIVNEYSTQQGEPIYHFDFYRINDIEEVFDFGYEDYFYSGHYCFVEWPELVEQLLPEETLLVELLLHPDESRELVF